MNSSVNKFKTSEKVENGNTMRTNILYNDIFLDKVETNKINDLNPNFNRVEVGKILSKKCENTLIIMKQENKKTKSPLPNYVRGTIKNNIFLKKKVRKRVNFPDKCMILVIEIESFKKYNYLNTNRDWLKKKSPSCKCNIY
jgi:hypothetical protein